MNLKTPILFIVFNRPEITAKVFFEIKKQKPTKLYIAADGPRKQIKGEDKIVEETRKVILDQIDWDCEVKTLFSENNLGCKEAEVKAMSWFFDNEEMGIILEDDCFPSQSFFPYCEKMLHKYKDNEKIHLISGHNGLGTWKENECDYFFSYIGNIWGWAGWRRVWKMYDPNMTNYYSKETKEQFKKLFGKNANFRFYTLSIAFKPHISTWDYPFAYVRHMQSGIGCVPSKNLIKNIGFGGEATHTTGKDPQHKLHEIDTNNLHHPSEIIVDKEFDAAYFKMRRGPYWKRIAERITDKLGIKKESKKLYRFIVNKFTRN